MATSWWTSANCGPAFRCGSTARRWRRICWSPWGPFATTTSQALAAARKWCFRESRGTRKFRPTTPWCSRQRMTVEGSGTPAANRGVWAAIRWPKKSRGWPTPIRLTMSVCLVEGQAGETCVGGGGAVATRLRRRGRPDTVVVRGSAATSSFEVMVASGGGSPSDSTLIQAHKGLDAACRFLAPGRAAALRRGDRSRGRIRRYVPVPRAPRTRMTILDEPRRRLGPVRPHHPAPAGEDLPLPRRTPLPPRSRARDPAGFRAGRRRSRRSSSAWRRECPGVTVGVMASGAVYPRS